MDSWGLRVGGPGKLPFWRTLYGTELGSVRRRLVGHIQQVTHLNICTLETYWTQPRPAVINFSSLLHHFQPAREYNAVQITN